MYQCENCRGTFSLKNDFCPRCGVRFTGTRNVSKLLRTPSQERAQLRRFENLLGLLAVAAILVLLALAGGAIGTLVGWAFGPGQHSSLAGAMLLPATVLISFAALALVDHLPDSLNPRARMVGHPWVFFISLFTLSATTAVVIWRLYF